VNSEPRENWERYWRDLPNAPGTAIWDSAAEVTVAAQLPWFDKYFSAELPVLDIGCGNGTQTRFLAGRFPRVLGLDFAPAAIEQARGQSGDSRAEFREFDLTDRDAARTLHAELGDCNIYLRGVLHQMPDEARPDAAASLAELLGSTGHLFAVELNTAAGRDIQAALAQGPDAVPKLKRVFAYGLTPAAWGEGGLEAVLERGGIRILDAGATTLYTTDRLAGGEPLNLPMSFVIGTR
jgi:SAM-dependent methyltransferase